MTWLRRGKACPPRGRLSPEAKVGRALQQRRGEQGLAEGILGFLLGGDSFLRAIVCRCLKLDNGQMWVLGRVEEVTQGGDKCY